LLVYVIGLPAQQAVVVSLAAVGAIAVIGASYRASIAASLGQSHGHEYVMAVIGGMRGWIAVGLPTTSEHNQAA
jgi:rhodanese-related sulfurtransferase